MAALAQNYPDEISHDRLGFAACLALVLHAAIILGISFSPEIRQQAVAKLEITLAQHRSDAPDEADFLAQHNQQGSGTLEEKAMLTAVEKADFQDNLIRQVTPQQQHSASEASLANSTQLLTESKSERQLQRQTEQQQREQQLAENQAEIAVLERSREIASLEAKLDIQRQAYAKRPRVRRLTSVATKQSDDALYLHHWREKIEAIGNKNYPELARQQKIYGELRLVVTLLPNGTVHSVKILESSGHKVLDQAAIRIVHLAAPYASFPGEMRKNVDVLEIIRTWRFHQNRLSSSS